MWEEQFVVVLDMRIVFRIVAVAEMVRFATTISLAPASVPTAMRKSIRSLAGATTFVVATDAVRVLRNRVRLQRSGPVTSAAPHEYGFSRNH